jgi:tRNA threonylcarbamoyladenosine biosynthesis protein TsaB
MTYLGLEFSSDTRSVAVAQDGRVLSRAEETGGRSTRAFALIDEALSAAGLEREAIEAIAIGLGPGSYTGIRVAISLAQGWHLARPVRLAGVSTVECLAAQARVLGVRGQVHVLIDAHREEFYHAAYDISEAGMKILTPLHLAPLATARKAAASGVALCGPEAVVQFPGARVVLPDAAMLLQLAASAQPGDQLQPIYLREVSFVKAPPPRIIAAD